VKGGAIRHLDVDLCLGAGTRPLGRLALHRGRVLFEYDAAFLAAPLPVSPAKLPVAPGTHAAPHAPFEGLFGLFADSLPDGWGRLLVDREADRVGVGRHALTPLDRLALVGASGPGAVAYRPAAGRYPSGMLELAALAAQARRVERGDAGEVFAEILALGGSSGGARPKALVSYRPSDGAATAGEAPGFVPAIVKFGREADGVDAGALEFAYAQVARAAGIEVSDCWLAGVGRARPGWFVTRRFDRLPRVHVHTLAGLLHADPRVPSLDYRDYLGVVRWLTRDQAAVDQAWLRAAFNVLAHNRDDHARNFAFVLDAGGAWRLSPAYDLTFSRGPGGEHWTTTCGEGRRPAADHLRQLGRDAGVAEAIVARGLDAVRTALSGWPAIARAAGARPATIRQIASVINP